MKFPFFKKYDQYLKTLSIYNVNYARRTRRLANALAIAICITLILMVTFSIPYFISFMLIPIAIIVSYTISKLVVNSRLKGFSQKLQIDALFHIARIMALRNYSIWQLKNLKIVKLLNC